MLDAWERFWNRVDKSGGSDACWPWVGDRFRSGYGRFYHQGKHYVAHRWMLGETRGKHLEWPRERGCHHCDNPPCCNPAHLYIGDAASNTADAMERSGHQWTRTHCPAGHEYTPDNIYMHPTAGKRCRQCSRDRSETRRRVKGAEPRAFKTHCLRGHEMAEDNLYVHPKTGKRQCRACKNLRQSKWAKKERTEARANRAA